MDEDTSAKLYEQAMQGEQGLYDIEMNDKPLSLPDDAVSSPKSNGNLSNGTTQVVSNVSTPEQRERTYTDESGASNGSVSKHTLIRLMREQVDLVRNLTNAQVAQKAELERVKEEKRELEEKQRRERERAQRSQPSQPTPYHHRADHTPPASSKLNLPTHVQRETSDNQSVSSRSFARYFTRAANKPHRHPDAEYFANNNRHRAFSAESNGPTDQPAGAKLNLPTHVQRDSSDNRSVSTRSLARYFGRSANKPRRHPDAEYFANANRHRGYSAESQGINVYEEQTLTNGNPSQASTIMPSAIVIDSGKAHNTGAFGEPTRPNYTGPGVLGTFGYCRDRIEITHIPERNVVPEQESTCISRMWWLFSRLCTLLIPDFLLCCIGRQSRVKKGMTKEQKQAARTARKEAKQAWREKVAIFFIMMFFSACFIGISGVIPMFLCRETTVFTMDEIQARDRAEDWTVIFGAIYDIKEYASIHPGGDQIRELIAKDASKVFPRRPAGSLPSMCVNRAKEFSREPVCDEFDEVDQLVRLHCHSSVGFRGIDEAMGEYEKGVFAHRLQNLKNDKSTEWIMIYNRIYNVTRYLDSIKDDLTGEIDVESEGAYLSDDLNTLLVNKRGQDATMVYRALYGEEDVALSCLDDLFYVGVLDEKDDILCRALNIAMYSVMIIIAAVLAIQCICSLIYLVRLKRTITRDDTRSKIIVMVPCYNEGDKELRKTIDSVMDTSYPDDNKVLLVVADGNITGKGEALSTPETLAKILRYKMSPKDHLYKCKSIGDLTENRAKLYSGIYKDAGKELKYLVVVKCGLPSEEGSSRAGNRGKRDSQLLFSGLLNRFHHGRELNDLDRGIKNALDLMHLPLDEVRYLMAIDADTRIDRESISHMTYSMNKNEHILALCGETKVDNKAQSWVTMIQVFEYYTNHHMKKAFESVFGCVTCLPGCFTMYRLFSDDGRPLLSCDDVYQRYATNDIKTLHDKNLYHLGEDRMLTTLLLRYFPDMRLSFVPEATCYTIVPHTFSVLLSQRRRWINSTFHNMLELMRVNTMCGVCCLSMKSIVILDLVATLILPASLIYVGYIVYITVWMGEPLSMLMLVVWGIVVGVQVVVFLLRSRWDYWWWFFIFILAGVPVFYFILPLYSFWHMDDFSWGTTRQVSGPTTVNTTKSRDETVITSDRDSPRGFEVEGTGVDETIYEVDEYDRPRGAASKKTKHSQPAASRASTGTRHHGSTPAETLDLKPKNLFHASVPVDVDDVSVDDTSDTKFDSRKYRDAEEAKMIRRMRRGEC